MGDELQMGLTMNVCISRSIVGAVVLWGGVMAVAAATEPPAAPAKPAKPAVPATRSVEVTLKITCDGQPLARVGLLIRWPRSPDAKAVKTDAQGRAVATLTLPVGEQRITVFPTPIARDIDMTDAVAPKEWTFADWYQFTVEASSAAQTFSIDVSPAREISLRPLLDGKAKSVIRVVAIQRARTPGVASVGSYLCMRRSADLVTEVALAGVPKDVATEVYVIPSGLFAKKITVPAGAENVSLGDIELGPAPSPLSVARITMTSEASNVHGHAENLSYGITLVASDPERILTFAVDNVKHLAYADDTYGKISLPAGRWFVAPGMFGGRDAQLRLLERMRSGEDLVAAGLPSVVIDGEHLDVSATFDAAAVERKILGLPEPVTEPKKR